MNYQIIPPGDKGAKLAKWRLLSQTHHKTQRGGERQHHNTRHQNIAQKMAALGHAPEPDQSSESDPGPENGYAPASDDKTRYGEKIAD